MSSFELKEMFDWIEACQARIEESPEQPNRIENNL
jgi:hypothetical protein